MRLDQILAPTQGAAQIPEQVLCRPAATCIATSAILAIRWPIWGIWQQTFKRKKKEKINGINLKCHPFFEIFGEWINCSPDASYYKVSLIIPVILQFL